LQPRGKGAASGGATGTRAQQHDWLVTSERVPRIEEKIQKVRRGRPWGTDAKQRIVMAGTRVKKDSKGSGIQPPRSHAQRKDISTRVPGEENRWKRQEIAVRGKKQKKNSRGVLGQRGKNLLRGVILKKIR